MERSQPAALGASEDDDDCADMGILGKQRAQVERVFSALVRAGHYESGLTARYERARAERVRVGTRIEEYRSPGFLGVAQRGIRRRGG